MNDLSIPIRGLRHLALRVRDLSRSKTFYSEVFGMHTVWEPDPHNCYLSSGCDNLALHQLAPGEDVGSAAQSLDHVGFIVATPEAVWAAADVLRGRAIPIVKEPRRHRDGSCSVYCLDPDGIVIQILYEPSISPLSFR